MSKITSTIWPIEPHTEAKHLILKRYLDAWLPIITRWNGRVLYIDGFAGPGEYIGKKDGSPIIAIKSILEHKANIQSEIKLIFIEADSKRCEFLKQKISALKIPPNISTECYCAKFDEFLTSALNDLDEQEKRIAPTLVFIDPFGFTGMPFKLIERIMKNKKCEVFITFMYEEINRFISKKELWNNFIELFGTEEWKKVLPVKDPNMRCNLLHDIYKSQLEKNAKISFVRSFKMKNKMNKTDYFLFFGTNNITGLKKIKEAMWKVDEGGAFQFSDTTYNPSQPMLFEKTPSYYLLKKIILNKFKGKNVNIQELENFIVTETSFRETHYKKNILVPMEKSDPPEIEIVKCSPKRRRGTFPPDCIIKFL